MPENPSIATLLPTRIAIDQRIALEQQALQGGGQNGVVVESGTTATTGPFTSLTALEESTFSAFVGTNFTGDAMTTVTIPAGASIFGKIASFTLATGSVVAYK